jgi:hypothetical protein
MMLGNVLGRCLVPFRAGRESAASKGGVDGVTMEWSNPQREPKGEGASPLAAGSVALIRWSGSLLILLSVLPEHRIQSATAAVGLRGDPERFR